MTNAAGSPLLGTRGRLINATEQCLRRSGIRRTTMVNIANEADVSRALLYRYFPDKSTIVVATLAHIDESFWANAHARVSAASGLVAQVAEAVLLSQPHADGALLLQLKATEPEAFASVVGTGIRGLMPAITDFWHVYVRAARSNSEVRNDINEAHAVEWIIRISLSLISIPGDLIDVEDPESLRRFLGEFLLPGLG